jgi:quercetin dioxygenase-like cupin family protein
MSCRRFLVASLLVLCATVVGAAEQKAAMTAQPAAPAAAPAAASGGMTEMRGASLQWAPLDLPGFVPGMKVAVLSGDPFKEGPYTIRLSFPAGYAFPAHWHPNVENLTVISGTFLLGMGDKTDASKLQKYTPGDFLYIPPQHPHFGSVEGDTVVQLHGPGPFGITVLEKIAGATPMAPATKP